MSPTAGQLQNATCSDLDTSLPNSLGPGAPTIYLPFFRKAWELWLASDARNDAWIR